MSSMTIEWSFMCNMSVLEKLQDLSIQHCIGNLKQNVSTVPYVVSLYLTHLKYIQNNDDREMLSFALKKIIFAWVQKFVDFADFSNIK